MDIQDIPLNTAYIHGIERLLQPCQIHFEPVGRWFEILLVRTLHQHDHHIAHDLHKDGQETLPKSPTDVEERIESEDEEESPELLSLDPKNWKSQDHYAVLGLSKLRFRSTKDDIKRAYRKKVLRHHPDKKAGMGLQNGQIYEDRDDFFKCISIAYDLLSNPLHRRQFDSVDPDFDETIPDIDDPRDFFQVYGPVFESNARFLKGSVPHFGDMNSTEEEVMNFYNSWVHFESWRMFEYLDEGHTLNTSREERRMIDRENRAIRTKRKNEDNQRIVRLVEQAYKLDPRIRSFKEERQREKEKRQKEKEHAITVAALEKAQREEEEKTERLCKEEEEKHAQDKHHREWEQVRNERRHLRKGVRQILIANDYFLCAEDYSKPQKRDLFIARQEKCLERLNETLTMEAFRSWANQFCDSSLHCKERADLFTQILQEHCIDTDGEIRTSPHQTTSIVPSSSLSTISNSSAGISRPWTEKELESLIHAIKVYPGGSCNRWERIREYVHIHTNEPQRTEAEVASKANELKSVRVSGHELVTMTNRFEKMRHDDDRIIDQPSLRIHINENNPMTHSPTQVVQPMETLTSPSSSLKPSHIKTALLESSSITCQWTASEQRLLEAALKKYPSTIPDRWDRISQEIPMRTKKECMLRFKELAELVRSKMQTSSTR